MGHVTSSKCRIITYTWATVEGGIIIITLQMRRQVQQVAKIDTGNKGRTVFQTQIVGL